MQAESAYVASLIESAGIEPDSAGFELVRQLGTDPGMVLTSAAMSRTLVRYDGGSLTLGEFREWLLTNPATMPEQVGSATDEQLSNLLQSLTRSELLVNDAKASGVEVPADRRDTLTAELLTGVKSVARELGFFAITREDGESREEAADRVVRGILVEIVQGMKEVFQLQTVAFALKEQYGARVFEPGIEQAVTRINELRLQPATPLESTLPGTAEDTATVDTAGNQG